MPPSPRSSPCRHMLPPLLLLSPSCWTAADPLSTRSTSSDASKHDGQAKVSLDAPDPSRLHIASQVDAALASNDGVKMETDPALLPPTPHHHHSQVPYRQSDVMREIRERYLRRLDLGHGQKMTLPERGWKVPPSSEHEVEVTSQRRAAV